MSVPHTYDGALSFLLCFEINTNVTLAMYVKHTNIGTYRFHRADCAGQQVRKHVKQSRSAVERDGHDCETWRDCLQIVVNV